MVFGIRCNSDKILIWFTQKFMVNNFLVLCCASEGAIVHRTDDL